MITDPHAPATREVVGTFSDRDHFMAAVDALIAAGFSRADLSVLSSHDSLDMMVGREGKPWREVLTAVAGDAKYEWPLVTAGIIALFAGPVAASAAALVAAGLGGAAAKEVLDEISAIPDSDDFERALAAGSVILWVIVRDQLEEEKARAALLSAGAANVHVFERKA
ncbi:MAG: hypothetical protein AB1918_15225 [Pseudomonadota bacterium]